MFRIFLHAPVAGFAGDTMEIIEETIGSADTCDIVLPKTAGLSSRHATLWRAGGRIFLRGEDPARTTRINGRMIPADRWNEIAKGDRIRMGELEIEVGKRLFSGERRLRLHCRELLRKSGSGSVLCEIPGVSVRPGELVAVLGPSGAGKSTLLDVFSGTVAPDSGAVWLEDSSGRVWEASPANGIGFVPQDDLLVPELTVGESLDFRLRLQFADMSPRIRWILIRDACGSLGLGESGMDAFLKRRIGDREDRKHGGLSSGERRRVAIAHELVAQAGMLVLDEPTSGLSSVEAERVVTVLRNLAREKSIPVIMSLHQPGRDAFAKVDRLVLIGPGGRLLFDGTATDAVTAIEAVSNLPCGDSNPAEYVLTAILDPAIDVSMQRQALETARKTVPAPPEAFDESASAAEALTPIAPGRLASFVVRVGTLLTRTLRTLVANPFVPGLLLAQAIGIAVLMVLALAGHEQDDSGGARFLRVAEAFQTLKAPYEEQGLPIPVDRLLREAEDLAERPAEPLARLDPSTATRRGSVYFLLATAAIWFGLTASCREVVADARSLRADVRAGRHPVLAYVIAKFIALSLFAGSGVIILSLIALPAILQLPPVAWARVAGILLLTSSAAVALGIAVSACARSTRIALTVVPLLILPQLLFSGFIRPIGAGSSDVQRDRLAAGLRDGFSDLMLQRWAFAACIAADPYANRGVTDYGYETESEDRYSKFNRLRFSETGLLARFFPETGPGAKPVWMMVLWLAFALLSAWGLCRMRVGRASNQ
jgi:ABC-type multidrug transport system ATPase subunit